MIKNQLYPYIEEYINSFLYGFTKEQLDVGVMNGQIKLENLNLRPDGVNDELDQKNIPFWLKAGLISKINFGCSLMNFIGEKPIEANIEGINIIITPSYKWIIQNLDSFVYEDLNEMKSKYVPYDNNSVSIFGKKINVLDNSVFNKDNLEKFFKDQTKISKFLNKFLIDCFSFYYSKNYALILKLKNIHIRFEDDQLINYMGNIAFGCKMDLFELTLSSEGTMKKNNFKITNLDFYWENNANILIPSSLLYDSIKNGILNEKYYTNLNKIKFENYTYKKDSKFIIQKLNCLCNFGTKALNKGKIDLFGKKENNYKVYIQFASNEIKINLFPDLFIIKNNFLKFIREFAILGQAQEFKPMKKPYNNKNRSFMEIMKHIKENKNNQFAKQFLYKRKMMVRDWMFYFYWCHKCKSSIENYNSNPLRLEFIRFFNLFNRNNGSIDDDLNYDKEKIKEKQKTEEGKPVWSRENPNPEGIILIFNSDIKIKGINLNLYPFISSKNNTEFICIKISNIDYKIFLNESKFEVNFSIKNINLGPNKLKSGEKVVINLRRKNIDSINYNTADSVNSYNNRATERYNSYLAVSDIDSNTGINGLLKKYNPNYAQQLNIIDKAVKKINQNNNENEQNKNNDSKNLEENGLKNKKNSVIPNHENHYKKINNSSFTKNIIQNYEANPSLQKMELKKQKNEFNISQAINHYNNNRSFQRHSTSKTSGIIDNNENQNSNTINNINEKININGVNNNTKINKKQNTQLIPTGKVIPLNLFELYSNNDTDKNSKCLHFKYTKINNNSSMDIINLILGVIRINLFSEYILKCSNILNDYRYSNNKAQIKFITNNLLLENDLDMGKKLFEMKKYFFEKLNKLPENKKTKSIQNYIIYLQNELNKAKPFLNESESYQINYIFSIFSKGLNVNIDFDNLECIYYSNKNNKICGKAIMPSPMFNFKVNPSNISFKLYDFEFEIEDLDNTKLLFKTLHTILEDKFKMAKLLIEPCMSQIKKELQKKQNESTSRGVNNGKHIENNLNKFIKNSFDPNIKNKSNKENIQNKTNEENKTGNENKIIKKEKEKITNNICLNNKNEKINNSPNNNKIEKSKESVKDINNNISNIIINNTINDNIANNLNIPSINKTIDNQKKPTHNKIIDNNNLKSKTIEEQNENKVNNNIQNNMINQNKNLAKEIKESNKIIIEKDKEIIPKENKNEKPKIPKKLPSTKGTFKKQQSKENLNLSKHSSKSKIIIDKKNDDNIPFKKNPEPAKKIVKGKKQIIKKKLDINTKK